MRPTLSAVSSECGHRCIQIAAITTTKVTLTIANMMTLAAAADAEGVAERTWMWMIDDEACE